VLNYTRSVVQQTPLLRYRNVVENSFDMLKIIFKKFYKKNLDVFFLPNVVVCYCILYNMFFNGEDLDIKTLML
jgi:hypothetical protein